MAKKLKFQLAEVGDRVKLRGRGTEGYLIYNNDGFCHVWWDYYNEENIDFWKGPWKSTGPWLVHINELEKVNET